MKHIVSTIIVLVFITSQVIAGSSSYTGLNNTTTVAKNAFISAKVWNDVNKNGIIEINENGLAGINVILIDNNSGNVVAETSSDANGNYSFSNITPGKYLVSFSTPNGFEISPNNTSSEASKNMGGVTETFELKAGEIVTDLNSGFHSEITYGLSK